MTVRLPRLQLVELEDLAWFPALIRDYGTDFLQFIQSRFALHEPMVPILRALMDESGTDRIIDLCSGGGGPLLDIQRVFAESGFLVDVLLTDKFPNTRALDRSANYGIPRVRYHSDAVDALEVPDHLKGCRTLFNAFHHFDPAAGQRVIAGAVRSGQPIAIFEIPDRRVSFALPLLLTPVFVWLTTPFIRPIGWRRLLFTYLIPAVPFLCLWDGVVSQFRAYEAEELRAIAEKADPEDLYEWEAGARRLPRAAGTVKYLAGRPKG